MVELCAPNGINRIHGVNYSEVYQKKRGSTASVIYELSCELYWWKCKDNVHTAMW